MDEFACFVHRCGPEQTLLERVKLRASQSNGCARCIDMRAKELRAAGEAALSAQRPGGIAVLQRARTCPCSGAALPLTGKLGATEF